MCIRRTMAACFLGVMFLLTGCLGGQPRVPQYDASVLYREYIKGDASAAQLAGRVVNVTGTVSRIDQSTAKNLFVELDKRIIVFIRADQVHRLGELGIKVGDAISAMGTFTGASVVSTWTTGSENDILVLENGEVVGKRAWLRF